MCAESSGTWDVLLPLRHLRRLTLPDWTAHDPHVVRTLSNMPWAPHVHYWGLQCGEHTHGGSAPWRVHRWLHQLESGPMDFDPVPSDEHDEEYDDEVWTSHRSLCTRQPHFAAPVIPVAPWTSADTLELLHMGLIVPSRHLCNGVIVVTWTQNILM